jgi:hypothetical protein
LEERRVPVSKQFVLAGDALFTIEMPAGSNPDDRGRTHYTWLVQHVEANERFGESYFAKLLTGPENTRDYTYVGRLDPFTGQVKTTQKSQQWEGTYPLRLLNRILARVWAGDHGAYEQHGFKTRHEGKCGRCGRTLTVPESIESGFGPECIKLVATAR